MSSMHAEIVHDKHAKQQQKDEFVFLLVGQYHKITTMLHYKVIFLCFDSAQDAIMLD